MDFKYLSVSFQATDREVVSTTGQGQVFPLKTTCPGTLYLNDHKAISDKTSHDIHKTTLHVFARDCFGV